ncbi:hypothetical protein SAMN05444007_106154 [Cribrihabitans marinus]|uniref:Uncharacterized protein n=1 Tax=Cribrihabitans marinus TaxID=1227549 RepID=A0A1H7AUY8_9RHOB|nr:hypothetical protein SAMN05444007_106154 [Cribrihabitans marinus]
MKDLLQIIRREGTALLGDAVGVAETGDSQRA